LAAVANSETFLLLSAIFQILMRQEA
jgi:hypothetical protein